MERFAGFCCRFNGWPTLMTAATLPMLVFCIYRLNIEEHMAWFWADFYGLGALPALLAV